MASRSGSADPLLFVYGTLMRSVGATAQHGRLVRSARLLGRGWVEGRLYDVAAYPALVAAAAPGERVQGEVYALDPLAAPDLLAELDAYEGYLPEAPGASLYLRERVQVTLADGSEVGAWAYLYNRPVAGLARIPSGSYAAWLRAR